MVKLICLMQIASEPILAILFSFLREKNMPFYEERGKNRHFGLILSLLRFDIIFYMKGE